MDLTEPLTPRGHTLKIMTDVKAMMWLLRIFLKKFILHLKTKQKKVGIRDGLHRECIDNCSLHFFGVSSEKNVNAVIIIALHKCRLMPVSPHNKALCPSSYEIQFNIDGQKKC